VAPTVRSFSAGFDPLGLIARWPERYPGLLESALRGARAEHTDFDILPISSGEVLRLGAGGRLSGPHAAGALGFLDALESWWSLLRAGADPAPPELPFHGGWLIYLGYEIAAEIEPTLRLPSRPDEPVALAIRTPAAWIRDRSTGRAWLIAEPGSEALLLRFEADLAGLPGAGEIPAAAPRFAVQEEEPARYLGAVRDALDYIGAGDVYQVNLSREWRAASQDPIAPTELYRRLRQENPGPFAALLRDGPWAVVSSSPERLVSMRGGVVATRPIAGTRPRGRSPARDEQLIRALLASDKERAEHVMLIDLERNDLGRVCVGGSVRVDEFMSVETYAHVHHIVSNLSGRLAPGVTPIAVLRALFPGGTITGCPKVRCMQIIAELEGRGRGAYTGSLGYLNRDGSGDFNILIRTLTAAPDGVAFRAGAGIVADSDPDFELAETRAKAKGMLRALGERAPEAGT
jgi:anthranilate synthase component 1